MRTAVLITALPAVAAALAVLSPAIAHAGEAKVWDVTRQCWRPPDADSCGATWNVESKTLETKAPEQPDAPTAPDVKASKTATANNSGAPASGSEASSRRKATAGDGDSTDSQNRNDTPADGDTGDSNGNTDTPAAGDSRADQTGGQGSDNSGNADKDGEAKSAKEHLKELQNAGPKAEKALDLLNDVMSDGSGPSSSKGAGSQGGS